ncbi:cysteine-rich repeat secretory protein 55-like [Bidens hawaiensis]|uniref:cysteine-rich repeat secretory protein 55-like n=1 Tax=Bidens hawaiensis TaxID=980011 RepID=UPI00404A7BC8
MVRYADVSSAGKLGEWAYATFPSPPNQSTYSAAELEKELNNLANKLKRPAVTKENKRYGSGSVTSESGLTLYGPMQCTFGIAEADCMKCLSDITNRLHNCCSKQRSLSGIAASTDCYFWYQHNNFLP